MKQELRRVDPIRAAKVVALLYGLTMTAITLAMSPFMLMAVFFGAGVGPRGAGLGVVGVLFFLLLYPLVGFVMGGISGLVISAIYNLVVRWTGGFLLEFEPAR